MLIKARDVMIEMFNLLIRLWFYFAVIVFHLGLILYQVDFVMTGTDPDLKHFFLQVKYLRPRVNDYTVVEHAWKDEKFIKRIIAVEGDSIRVNEAGEVFVNEKRVPLRQWDKGSLAPMSFQVIPKGHVFLYGSHHDSPNLPDADGMVSLEDFKGRVFALC